MMTRPSLTMRGCFHWEKREHLATTGIEPMSPLSDLLSEGCLARLSPPSTEPYYYLPFEPALYMNLSSYKIA